MYNLDVTILEGSQVFGDNRLDIFDKYGTRAAITDFAILLGGDVSNNYHTSEGNELKDRTGWYFLKTNYYSNFKYVKAVDSEGVLRQTFVVKRNKSIRPVLKYSLISNQCSKVRVNGFGIKEVEYGEYPQTIVNERLSSELESLYIKGELNETGKRYTTDSRSIYYIDDDKKFLARTHKEYLYKGKKYIRILGDSNSIGKTLSDGRIVEEGKTYFVKVEPIVWFIDEKRDITITKKLLFSGGVSGMTLI